MYANFPYMDGMGFVVKKLNKEQSDVKHSEVNQLAHQIWQSW